jgi:hypothetical protein
MATHGNSAHFRVHHLGTDVDRRRKVGVKRVQSFEQVVAQLSRRHVRRQGERRRRRVSHRRSGFVFLR